MDAEREARELLEQAMREQRTEDGAAISDPAALPDEVIENAVKRAEIIVRLVDAGQGGQFSVVMEDMARALLALRARAQQERQR